MIRYKFLLFLFLPILLCMCITVNIHSDLTPENTFTDGIEGPATDREGNIYAVNYNRQGTIGKVAPDGKHNLFVELQNGSIGNGIRFDKNQVMYVADYTNHNILEIDMVTKAISVFAHNPKANQPNDLTIAPNGTIYASDPNWSNSTGNLWKITKDKGFQILEENMGTTNGIEVSPEGTKLYVNESVQRNIWSYDIASDGQISNKTLLHSFKDFGLDGMRFHKNGNLYVCRYGKGTVAVLSTSGELIKEIQLTGKKPTNITFSPDFSKGYVTVADRGCIEQIMLN
ncbi:MAG: SMP-30/gluconolactonase/LRE family protein [Saprospiraceae bacterium]|nr:SMP-30/gluconolactonase/LRE family protein [Saprospiraceae bacterium]